MVIRPARPADLEGLIEIDATIDSAQYLHVERGGEGLEVHWKIQERLLREKRIERNRLHGDVQFHLKQVVSGADEGTALVAEHDDALVAMLLAQPQPEFGTERIIDLRVDFDHRRQGLATAMLYQVIAGAREREVRAVAAECRTDNIAACRLFAKLAFELTGLDTQRHSNHDLVKESATLFWYAALD